MKKDVMRNGLSPQEMAKRAIRKRYGIRISCSLIPYGKVIQANCECEGKVYKAKGKTHTEAMLNVTNLVNEKKLSLEK